MIAAFAFVPGLAIGSFLNVVAARVPAHRSVVRPRSACPECEAPIAARDNIPIVSYLLLRGRCRNCGVRIPWRYPAVEVATALLVAGCFLDFGLTFKAGIAALFCVFLVVLAAIDLEHRIIPNRIVLPAALVILALQTARDPSVEWAVAGFGAAAFLLLAAIAYPKGMGMGDVKLALLLGFGLGRTVPIGLFVGMVAALIPSLVLVARHGAAARKMAIPFGPFLAVGGVVALFAGKKILDAWLGLH